MCTMLKFPDDQERAERNIVKGRYPVGKWAHMCPGKMKGKTGLVRVWMSKDMKCPFCDRHPE